MDEEKKDERPKLERPAWMAVAVLSSGKRKSGLFANHEEFAVFVTEILEADADAIIWYAVPSPMKVTEEKKAEWRARFTKHDSDSPK